MATKKNTANGKKESVINQLRLIFPDTFHSLTHALDIKEDSGMTRIYTAILPKKPNDYANISF